MFVADNPGDLSAATLYAAKWNQMSPDGTDGGEAFLTWINLGHASHTEIKAAVGAGITFNDLFNTSTTAAAGFTAIKTGHEVAKVEYLQLKTGNFSTGTPIATLAAFLETRRYAALMGATTEFEKFEGVAYNAKDNKAYTAMTRMTNGMENRAIGATETANDIRLKKNSSGGVYELSLVAGRTDTSGATINSDFVPTLMKAIVIGKDITADADGNKSDLNGIASPDNLSFSEHMRVLFIGEDSSNHVNNYLWAYHVDTGSLVRILSIPMGAESTGLQVVDNMKGRAYIMSNYQHAGDLNSTNTTVYNRILPLINTNKAEIGYLGGLPAMH
jgi:secreted PhoX family phosphatase